MKINIVGGSGAMGRVHKPLFEEYGFEVIITGRDSSISIEEGCRISDVTIISVPIENFKEVASKVVGNSKAIMDFTGLKEMPVNYLIENASEDVELCGLHPLYGEVSSVRDEIMVVCKTPRTGRNCEEVLTCFRDSGIILKEMSSLDHDRIVGGITQNARVKLLEVYSELLKRRGILISELKEVSPPPTRAILDMIEKQEGNKELYRQMRDNNKFSIGIEDDLREVFEDLFD